MRRNLVVVKEIQTATKACVAVRRALAMARSAQVTGFPRSMFSLPVNSLRHHAAVGER